MFNKKIVLGSSSPRRIELITNLGFVCVVRKNEVEEIHPFDLATDKIPEYLSELKAQPLKEAIQQNEVLLTSDTVVVLNDRILEKAENAKEAKEMLLELSGKSHEVITGVHLYNPEKELSFTVKTKVFFKTLTLAEIDYYIKHFQPFDKAGAYGIQEWIGKIGVQKIEGCYYNVMGLPVNKVWETLHKEF